MGADAIALAAHDGLADRASGAAVRGQSGRIWVVVRRGSHEGIANAHSARGGDDIGIGVVWVGHWRTFTLVGREQPGADDAPCLRASALFLVEFV